MNNAFTLDELRSLDLNLLLVLSVMVRERSVRETAIRLGVGSPAVSMSLSRLRRTFNDPLFVRHSRGMVPTPRAIEIAEIVDPFLQAVRFEVQSRRRLDLKSVRRTVRFAVADDLESVLLPRLLATIQEEAPGIQLIVRDADYHSIDQALLSGEAEVVFAALIPEDRLTEPFRKLYRDRFVSLFDPRRLDLGETLDLETYLATPQLLVSPRGQTSGMLDVPLRELGVSRHIMATLFRFSTLPSVLKTTRALCNVPSLAGGQLARDNGLSIRPLPFDSIEFQVGVAWQRTLDKDPLTRWLIERICQLVSEIRGDGPSS